MYIKVGEIEVEDQDGQITYQVNVNDNTCSCQAFANESRIPCKHLFYVHLYAPQDHYLDIMAQQQVEKEVAVAFGHGSIEDK